MVGMKRFTAMSLACAVTLSSLFDLDIDVLAPSGNWLYWVRAAMDRGGLMLVDMNRIIAIPLACAVASSDALAQR